MRTKPYILFILALAALPHLAISQTNLITESFESDGESSMYRSNSFDDGTQDYFIRTGATGNTFSDPFTNLDGNLLWGGEDIEEIDNPLGQGERGYVVIKTVDVSSYSHFDVKLLLGARGIGGIFESSDFIKVEYALDGNIISSAQSAGAVPTNVSDVNGGTYAIALAFYGDNDLSGTGYLSQDNDLNGSSDGVNQLSSAMTEFSTANIPTGGATLLSIRIVIGSDTGGEDIAFDNVRIDGVNLCSDPNVPTLTASHNPSCPGAVDTINISGNLNDATGWTIYTGSCGGSIEGATAGALYVVFPSVTTTYYVRGEGGCVTPGACDSITVVVQDTTKPVVTCLLDQTLIADSNCQVTVPDYTSQVTFSDNCDPSPDITQKPAAGTLVSTDTVITIMVADSSGNADSCTFALQVQDTLKPTITCPGDIISCDSMITYTSPMATDACSMGVLLIQTDSTGLTSGSSFPVGITAQQYTVIDEQGNQATCTFYVTVAPAEKRTIQVNDSLLTCIPPAATYQWFRDGNLISGANMQTYIADLTGAYSVAVTDTNGCDTVSDTVQVIITGLPTEESLSGLQVFPNPTSSAIRCQYRSAHAGSVSLALYNTLGQLMILEEKNAVAGLNREQVDLAGLPAGTYYLRLIAPFSSVGIQVTKLENLE
ncbi:MAG: HYR domain-containing protein [Flavobacteriales bacterium]|nr:HYR domain-containing protein [Flavobacteriales bacterium]